MKKIERISDQIEDEIEDALEYAQWALEVKDSDADFARILLANSKEELEHADRLHNKVVAYINEYRQLHGDPPADMLARYEYLHNRHIKDVTHVKIIQSMI